MSYQDRNMLALGDLKKLISYKVKKGISDKWILNAIGYYEAFQRCVDKEALEDEVTILMHCYDLDGRILLEDVPRKSVRASNSVIVDELGITLRMAASLNLVTLREDANRMNKLRWNRTKERIPRAVYLSRFQTNKKEMKMNIERLMSKGVNKSEIAREMGISRQTVYNILKI
ncbi:helix-turn-helix domain-containing protein [Bacillus cereus]|uniref:helix-turn-helix domain-containing protein n=1 Tax=Bacillus cereus TaxID=1396 RepID=UPI00218035D1|nr:helix-turn-helix domain-containing protein [Bacillus cereus]UWJ21257.1 hypothetical protein FORC10_p017 [Bacillus cereus]